MYAPVAPPSPGSSMISELFGWRVRGRQRTARIDLLLDALERSVVAADRERERLREAIAVSHAALGAMHDLLTGLARQPDRFDQVFGELDGVARRIASAGHALSDACDVIAAGVAAHAAVPEASIAAVDASARASFETLGNDLATLVSSAGATFDAAVLGTGTAAAERITHELAPVRQAAEDHAEWLRTALQRLRGETDALTGAQQAAAAVRTLSAATEAELRLVVETFRQRNLAASEAAERAARRLDQAGEQASSAASRLHSVIGTQGKRPDS